MAMTPPVASAHPRPPQDNHPQQPPWLEHPTLFGLPGRLQQVYDCYLMRLEAARPTGFYRDALRIYVRMLS